MKIKMALGFKHEKCRACERETGYLRRNGVLWCSHCGTRRVKLPENHTAGGIMWRALANAKQ